MMEFGSVCEACFVAQPESSDQDVMRITSIRANNGCGPRSLDRCSERARPERSTIGLSPEDGLKNAASTSCRHSISAQMISFIVPAYNEELELSSTLAAICASASGAAQPHEIIVVDDASTDATAKVAAAAGARVISINRRQIAAARNAGAFAARGAYLIFVDVAFRIRPRHVDVVIAAFNECYGGGSGGGVMACLVRLG